MMNKIITFSLLMVISALFPSHAAEENNEQAKLPDGYIPGWDPALPASGSNTQLARKVESMADKLMNRSFDNIKQSGSPVKFQEQSCKTDGSAMITIYSTNGMAQNEIEVKIDGSPVGNLTSYYPDGDPGCKTQNARGIITIEVPAGQHTLEADSSNISWPKHSFSVEKCECMLLPLS